MAYISWIYDSPIPHFQNFDSPYNHVFHFDKMDVQEYIQKGYQQIHHLPLAVNTERLDNQLTALTQKPEYYHDITFVGNLYTNRSIQAHNFVSSDYIQGVLQGYAAAQSQFFNHDIVGELIKKSPFINVNAFSEDFPLEHLIRSVHEEAIMGCGGFLMTTPQPELFDYFVPDEDFVTFTSFEELVDKCNYYLLHEEERHQIAMNGYQKVKGAHTYEARFPELFAFI